MLPFARQFPLPGYAFTYESQLTIMSGKVIYNWRYRFARLVGEHFLLMYKARNAVEPIKIVDLKNGASDLAQVVCPAINDAALSAANALPSTYRCRCFDGSSASTIQTASQATRVCHLEY